ncbi:MAG: radical SAM protein [Chloroflexota bacterium]
MAEFRAAYLSLLDSGELERRAGEARRRLERCDLCAWECRADRLAGRLGVCQTGAVALVSSYGPHLGEEDPLRGWRGSGTIFFARCNLRCQFCQNHDISQTDAGLPLDDEQLAQIMLALQDEGCHNINLVSPTHVLAQIIEAVLLAARQGLRLPLVYNTGGYDSPGGLRLLDGIIDIYMPDMKYASAQTGQRLSRVKNYPRVNQAAVLEMHRQVGDLQLDENGLATRGLLVRHLLLPNGVSGVNDVVRFLAQAISPATYLNLMDQYHPEYNVRQNPHQYPQLNRPVTRAEYQAAVQLAQAAGLTRLDPHPALY